MIQSSVESSRTLTKKVCSECGEQMKAEADLYLMECDRCLSKKVEE